MLLRPATLTDVEPIAAIHLAAWKIGYRGLLPDDFLDALTIEDRIAAWRADLTTRRPGVEVILALKNAEDDAEQHAAHDSQILGWTSIGPMRDEAASTTGELWAIYIHPDHWRRGIGRTLLTAAEQSLARRGYREMILWLLHNNTRAQRFYEACGFTLDPERLKQRQWRSHSTSLPIDVVRMSKPVASGPSSTPGMIHVR